MSVKITLKLQYHPGASMWDIYKGVWHLQLQQGWAIFDIFKALYQIRQNKHDCECGSVYL